MQKLQSSYITKNNGQMLSALRRITSPLMCLSLQIYQQTALLYKGGTDKFVWKQRQELNSCSCHKI